MRRLNGGLVGQLLKGALAAAVIVSCVPLSHVSVFAGTKHSTTKHIAHAVTLQGLRVSDKPSFRVDAANSGRMTTNGPASLPSQTFEAFGRTFERLDGIQLDTVSGQDNVIASSQLAACRREVS